MARIGTYGPGARVLYFLLFLESTAFTQLHQCRPPELLAERDGVFVYQLDDFLSADESAALLSERDRRASNLWSSSTPLVCFNAVSSLYWYTYPHGRRARFLPGTLCTNETQSEALLDPNPENGRAITYSTSNALYPGELALVDSIARRAETLLAGLGIASLLGEAHGGKFQLTRYEHGQGYAKHTDCSKV